jgi:hypothetical protein
MTPIPNFVEIRLEVSDMKHAGGRMETTFPLCVHFIQKPNKNVGGSVSKIRLILTDPCTDLTDSKNRFSIFNFTETLLPNYYHHHHHHHHYVYFLHRIYKGTHNGDVCPSVHMRA